MLHPCYVFSRRDFVQRMEYEELKQMLREIGLELLARFIEDLEKEYKEKDLVFDLMGPPGGKWKMIYLYGKYYI